MPKLEARVSEHDRQIAAIRKLVLQGMKMIVQLTAAQRKTDAQLSAIPSWAVADLWSPIERSVLAYTDDLDGIQNLTVCSK